MYHTRHSVIVVVLNAFSGPNDVMNLPPDGPPNSSRSMDNVPVVIGRRIVVFDITPSLALACRIYALTVSAEYGKPPASVTGFFLATAIGTSK
jgi:hypothetical protein